ncbi:F0F1 ATP synthase subunit delta [Gracilibacillus alcaliphilus]|uniref:F0F1 ATP synthase subunit delta n=1 Tax=Gracilibacillus alcaliphilus TaxID=1401441 RepID=UPI001959D713|nr:F0F1 ATP synthase subunit delta [Gracilibacillus alcaliphilus]MBM7677201.1 F-type H+-transporting ATPase subunit delta [Gracilibacillus alcaliphilus]
MSNTTVAKRYAEALFEIAQTKGTADVLEAELTTVKEVFITNAELLAFLQHPKVAAEKKKELLTSAFTGFSKDVLHTLFMLVDRHNEKIVPEVADHFITFNNKVKGIEEAAVYSARELTQEEQQALQGVFTRKLNVSALKINNIVDPSILGGIRIRIGNTVYDGSIKGKLNRLERQITAVN